MSDTATQQPQQVAASPTTQLAGEAALLAIYATLSAALLRDFAKVLRGTTPDAAGNAALMAGLRHVTRTNLVRTSALIPSAIATLMHAVRRDAVADAATAIGHAGGADLPPNHPGLGGDMFGDLYRTHAQQSVDVLEAALLDDARAVHAAVLRAPNDVYREVTAAVAKVQVGDTGTTPAMARAQAFAEYAQRGITGFTDRSGRDWALETYTDMAVRSASMRAYNEAYQAELRARGVTLYTVPGDGHPCPLCLPWQGQILCDGDVVLEGADATVEDARAAGLLHPNCRHVLLPYFPGVSHKDERAEWTPAHAAAYGATQRLRALERRVRGLKVAEQDAIDPVVKSDLRRAIRATQAAIRGHVDEHGLVRRRAREQAPDRLG